MGHHSVLTRQLIADGCAPREVPLFEPAFISEGPELEKALASLGLHQGAPARPRLFAPLVAGLGCAGGFAGLVAMLWGSVNFMLWALSLVDPSRVPQ